MNDSDPMTQDRLYSGEIPHWQEEGYPYIWMPYTQMETSPLPVPVVETSGVRMKLSDGTELIDSLASWWSACHGFNHPRIVEAVTEQAKIMPHVMFGGVNHPQALKLAKRLATMLPEDLDHVFLSDSGSVSVEVSMKMAVQYWLNQSITGRHRFISFKHGYHGDTTGAMSVCDPVNGMHSHFKGFLMEQYPLDMPVTKSDFIEFESFVKSHAETVAAVIMEPLVQGAGGMRFHPAETLSRIRSICDQYNLLLIFDEIATGFGRTGTMFACEQAEVVPDIICLSKALTGGTMGLAATIARTHVFEQFLSENPMHALMHGPTYMGNPLACAAANASLDLFEEEPRLEQAIQLEGIIRDELSPCSSITGVVDVRAKGAIGVVQVEKLHHLDWLRARFVKEGVWIRPFGDAIYITPALVMSEEDIQTVCRAMVKVIGEWSRLDQ